MSKLFAFQCGTYCKVLRILFYILLLIIQENIYYRIYNITKYIIQKQYLHTT